MTVNHIGATGHWEINDLGVIDYLVAGHGIAVSAVEIWEAEYVPEESKLPQPSVELPHIEFAAAMLDVVLVLERDADGHAVLQLATSLDSGYVTLPTWPQTDQLLLGSRWHALDKAHVVELRSALSQHDINIGRRLSNQQLMWLYWSSGFGLDPLKELKDRPTGLEPDGPSDHFEPELIRASLYPYQVNGARFLGGMADQELGALLADEMGLGKTIQAIYLISRERDRKRGTTLVVCPSSLITNWQREIIRFTPWLSVSIHRGVERTGDPTFLEQFDVVLTSYDVLVRDVAVLESLRWNLVVLDEAQSIKNSDAKRSLAAKRLQRRVGVAITGTPIENSLRDMWSIFEFIAPAYLGARAQFERRYPDELTAARALSLRVAPMTLRRMVSDVAQDLPPRVDIPVAIDGGPRFAQEYEALRSTPNIAALALLTKLRQVCASPRALGAAFPRLEDFTKYDVALRIMFEAFEKSEKVLLFASYLEALDLIADDLRDRLPAVFLRVLDGRTSADERQKAIDDFSAHVGPGVLLMNPRATGVGLNIQAASHVIHYTPEWNPAIVAQATARAHRRGQNRPVFVHYLYLVDTVEEVMIDRLNSKRELQDAGLSGIDGDLSQSDILEALALTPARSPNAS